MHSYASEDGKTHKHMPFALHLTFTAIWLKSIKIVENKNWNK